MAAAVLPVLLMLAQMCLPTSGLAAFKSVNETPGAQASCNPRPAPDDILLPMPCGMQLAMRAVAIPGVAPMSDRRFSMGVGGQDDADRTFYERRYDSHIGAPFTAADLPAAWRAKTGQGRGTFYFMGKYELSNQQWAAVMDSLDDQGNHNPASCPSPGKGSNLPKSGMTWFEAQNFLLRFNAWLMKNHADELPRFDGTKNMGYLRLPTEEEWEFAARGGMNVPAEWWVDNDFFPMNGTSPEDYGVFSGGEILSGALPIGSRNANPLGLYDTMGNVREMTDGFFRLSVADKGAAGVYRRLHGSAGGLIAKGGSFRSQQPEVRPGARDETPLFTERGAASAGDLGLRLTLGGINIPSSQRLAALRRAEHDTPGAPAGAPDIAKLTPIQAVESIGGSTRDPAVKNSLMILREMLADEESARNKRDQDNLENTLRSLLYQQEAVRAYALRAVVSSEKLAELDGLLKRPMDDATRSKALEVKKSLQNDIAGFRQTMLMLVSHYLDTLAGQVRLGKGDMAALIRQFRSEYGDRDDVFGTHMKQNIDTLEKHMRGLGSGGQGVPDARQAMKDIVPERHYRQMNLWK